MVPGIGERAPPIPDVMAESLADGLVRRDDLLDKSLADVDEEVSKVDDDTVPDDNDDCDKDE